ncbi:hypothetical protein [Nitrospira sp. Ecomares 2.1]
MKRVVAYLSLGQHRLLEALRKKVGGPVHRRELVQWFQGTFTVSGGRACPLAPQLKRASGIDGAGPRINRPCVIGSLIGRMPVRDLDIWGSGSSCVAKSPRWIKNPSAVCRLGGLQLRIRVRRRK